MIKILTDSKTKEQFKIVTSGNKYLPCYGEDGVIYYWITNLFVWDGYPRDDCRILDIQQGIGLIPERNGDNNQILRWDGEESQFSSLEDIENLIQKLNQEKL